MRARRGIILVLLASGVLVMAGAFSLVQGGSAPAAQADASRSESTQPASATPGETPRRLRGEAPRRAENVQAGEVLTRLARAAMTEEQEEETKRRQLLDVDPTLPLEAQQSQFLDRLSAATGVDPRKPEAQLVRPQATELFLRLEPVQAHLAAMPVEERRAALADIRRRMGYSEEMIAREAANDMQRDARWENGYAYMQARAELFSRNAQGEALEAELHALREQYFGREASTIAREEDAGFFRFQRRRVYGRN